MSYTLRDRSTRAEVWRWYWRNWKSKFWSIHLFVAAVLAYLIPATRSSQVSISDFLSTLVVTVPVVIVLMAIAPQVMFKNKERVLIVDQAGWSTQIGSRSGARSWTQVAYVEDAGDVVVIAGVNGNALIIPTRIFGNATSKAQFVNDAQTWRSSAR